MLEHRSCLECFSAVNRAVINILATPFFFFLSFLVDILVSFIMIHFG